MQAKFTVMMRYIETTHSYTYAALLIPYFTLIHFFYNDDALSQKLVKIKNALIPTLQLLSFYLFTY